ncbi:hypothetical protein CHARACLAT_029498 [Characodon lateralis]|uniref:Uncharacterized protein n=1 Tax=Characodon lateralis TaxID=208331 RepID=A0ABU7DCY6_9TELE|nr:hypothetical protein [Characodon lateralis]
MLRNELHTAHADRAEQMPETNKHQLKTKHLKRCFSVKYFEMFSNSKNSYLPKIHVYQAVTYCEYCRRSDFCLSHQAQISSSLLPQSIKLNLAAQRNIVQDCICQNNVKHFLKQEQQSSPSNSRQTYVPLSV